MVDNRMIKTKAHFTIRFLEIIVIVVSILPLNACTFSNIATFSVEGSAKPDELLNKIEIYLTGLGLQLERKVDLEYPEKKKERSYFLGRARDPVPLHTTYSYLVLRLEESNVLYIDWIEISDTKRVPKPEYFDAMHKKIAADIKDHFGVIVKFRFIEAK